MEALGKHQNSGCFRESFQSVLWSADLHNLGPINVFTERGTIRVANGVRCDNTIIWANEARFHGIISDNNKLPGSLCGGVCPSFRQRFWGRQ